MTDLQSQGYLDFLEQQISPERFKRFKKIIEGRTRQLTVVLENIFQPHNSSAVLRTCEGLGIQDIHIIETIYAFETKAQVSLGSSSWLTVHRYRGEEFSTTSVLSKLKEDGYEIWATSPYNPDLTLDSAEWPLNQKIALLFGTEKEGLSEEALSMSDRFISIPMYGLTESYNISVSVAMCVYGLQKELRKTCDWGLSSEEKRLLMIEWCEKSSRRTLQLREQFLNHKI
jgi:tRNA (guanosine-2'-O-)-methyltransferase